MDELVDEFGHQYFKARMKMLLDSSEFKERLSDLIHNQWSGWMDHLFSKSIEEKGQFDIETGSMIIPQWAVKRWTRQMNTTYKKLAGKEKDSDRKEADKFLHLIRDNLLNL